MFRMIFKFIAFVLFLVVSVVALYVLYLYTGKPHIDINYIEKINHANRVDPPLNAALIYQQAIDKFVDIEEEAKKSGNFNHPVTYASFFDTEWQDMPQDKCGLFIENLNQNAEAIKLYKQAAQLPSYWMQRAEQPDFLMHVAMPELSHMRDLMFLLAIEAEFKIQNKNYNNALENYFTIIKTGRLLNSLKIKTHIEDLVGISIRAQGYQRIMEMLSNGQLSNADLERVKLFLNEYAENGADTIALQGEKMSFMDLVQHTYTPDTFGRGHFAPSAIKLLDVTDSLSDEIPEWIFGMGGAILFAQRSGVEKMFDGRFAFQEELFTTVPWESRNMTLPVQYDLEEVPYSMQLKYFIVDAYGAVMDKISRLKYRLQNDYYAALVILSLHQYKLSRGQFPDNLEQLAEAGLIDLVPRDAFGPGNFIYTRLNDDFTLYSYGVNYQDDGGKWGFKKYKEDKTSKFDDGQIKYKYYGDPKRIGGYGGDDVFWPLEQTETDAN